MFSPARFQAKANLAGSFKRDRAATAMAASGCCCASGPLLLLPPILWQVLSSSSPSSSKSNRVTHTQRETGSSRPSRQPSPPMLVPITFGPFNTIPLTAAACAFGLLLLRPSDRTGCLAPVCAFSFSPPAQPGSQPAPAVSHQAELVNVNRRAALSRREPRDGDREKVACSLASGYNQIFIVLIIIDYCLMVAYIHKQHT